MKRLRFNLCNLFIIVALVADFLGYAQWRRQSILRELNELDEKGFTVTVRDEWSNIIWPVFATEATYTYRDVCDYKVQVGTKTYDPRELVKQNRTINDRLYLLGVEKIAIERNGTIVGVTSTDRRITGN